MATQCPKCKAENPDTQKFCGECAAPLQPSKDIGVTKTIETFAEEFTRGATFADRYEIIEVLGKGGMGTVYKVEDTKIRQDIALKLIKPEIASDKKTIERFRNELKTTRMISHRNVCRMFDLGDSEGKHFITMEYIPGEDLKSLIRRVKQIPEGTAISIAKQVCEGLAEAHRLGVVHRDLKSNNIMIDKEGNARIMDFGIARSLETKGITGAGIIIGTPEYMSPEQVEVKEVDQRSDIYSLGIILYEMVTGNVPFEGETPFGIAMKHKTEMPKDPRELNTQLSENLCQVILKCMEKDKEKRYQSAEEVQSELENIEKGIPTTERIMPKRKPFTSREITVKFNMRKLFIPAVILVAVVIIGFILWSVLPKEKAVLSFPSDRPSIAVLYFMNQTGDESLDHWRKALPSWIITDLSQSKHIRVLSEDSLFGIFRKLDLLEAQNYAREDLKNIAKEGRINHIFQARYSKAGDIFRIDFSLQKADTFEIIASDYVTGESEESFPSLVDDITKRVKADLKISEKHLISEVDKEAKTITTNSPEAFRYYSLGMELKRQGNNRKSIEMFEQAVAIDPEFAMAYRAMAIAYGAFNRTKKKEMFQKALSLADRSSERERYLIEAGFYGMSEKTWEKAIEIYEKLLEIYPDDLIGRNNVAIIYSITEQWQKAIEHYELAVKYNTPFWAAYLNLAYWYDALGLYDKAKEIREAILNRLPDDVRIHFDSAQSYRNQGKYEQAFEVMDQVFAIDPTNWNINLERGDIYFWMADFIKAEGEYRKLLEKEERRAKTMGMERIGHLYLLKGRFGESYNFAQRGLELAEKMGDRNLIRNLMSGLAYLDRRRGSPENALKKYDILWEAAVEDPRLDSQIFALYGKGLACIEMEETSEAQRVAEDLKEIIEQGLNKNRMRMYYHLMGVIETERGNYTEALNYFKMGLPLLLLIKFMQIIYSDSLGHVYYQSGDIEKAREEYGKIPNLKHGRLVYGDIYAKSFYMLGKICEEQGDILKAIEHYKKFLDLWKDADPGIAEVDDARERLARFK